LRNEPAQGERAHDIEPQGDGIEMVLIRMDEILAAARAARRKKPKKPKGKK
jgi:hypothetical protein